VDGAFRRSSGVEAAVEHRAAIGPPPPVSSPRPRAGEDDERSWTRRARVAPLTHVRADSETSGFDRGRCQDMKLVPLKNGPKTGHGIARPRLRLTLSRPESGERRALLIRVSSHGLRPHQWRELANRTRIVPSDIGDLTVPKSTAMRRDPSSGRAPRPIVTTWNLPTSPGISFLSVLTFRRSGVYGPLRRGPPALSYSLSLFSFPLLA